MAAESHITGTSLFGQWAAMAWVGTVSLSLWACSPTLNWREVTVDAGARAMFPCRPDSNLRTVSLAGKSVDLHLRVCDAGGAMWALARASAADSAGAGQLQIDLRRALEANLRGSEQILVPPVLNNTAFARTVVIVTGHHPDGSPAQAHAAFLVAGASVFQLVVLSHPGGTLPDDESRHYFLNNLRLAQPAVR